MLSHNLVPKSFADTFGKISETSDMGGLSEVSQLVLLTFNRIKLKR